MGFPNSLDLFSLRRKKLKSGGNAEFLTLNRDRKSNIDITKLKNLVEKEGGMLTDDMKVTIEKECKEKNNSCFQSFLIDFAYGGAALSSKMLKHVRRNQANELDNVIGELANVFVMRSCKYSFTSNPSPKTKIVTLGYIRFLKRG